MSKYEIVIRVNASADIPDEDYEKYSAEEIIRFLKETEEAIAETFKDNMNDGAKIKVEAEIIPNKKEK